MKELGEEVAQINHLSLSLEKSIKHLFYENKISEKNEGENKLGIGFPILKKSYRGIQLAMPLFIAKVEIHPLNSDVWSLRKDKHEELILNPLFSKILESEGKRLALDLVKRQDTASMKFNDIIEFCYSVSRLAGLSLHGFEEDMIRPVNLDSDSINLHYQKDTLIFSTFLASFPNHHFGLGFSSDPIKEFWFENVSTAKVGPSIFNMDPWQKTAFKGAMDAKLSLIEGKAGNWKNKAFGQYVGNIPFSRKEMFGCF